MKLCFFFIALFAFKSISAQVITTTYSTSRVGKSGVFSKRDNIKAYILSELDPSQIMDLNNETKNKPFKFAYVRKVNLNLSDGNWEQITDDTLVWKIKIVSKKLHPFH